jgi:mono/diheme cytochrome c family protein
MHEPLAHNRWIFRWLPAAALAFALGTGLGCAPSPAQAGDSAGEKVFADQKCAKCHKPGSKRDLAGVGKKHDAKWLTAFLKHEEAIDGKKHKKKFTGTDAELEALVKWLASLK